MDVKNDLRELSEEFGFIDTKIKAQISIRKMIEYELNIDCDLPIIIYEIESLKSINESIISRCNEMLDLIKMKRSKNHGLRKQDFYCEQRQLC